MGKPSRKGGLGKGLSDLLGQDLSQDPSTIEEGLHELEIIKIQPNGQQPRKNFKEDSMRELEESIRLHGVVTPIAVRPDDHGGYQIIAGERRWRAARSAGLLTIPAKVIKADQQTTMEMALIENLQRQDLNPVEEAEGYHALMEEYGMTQEDVAKRMGKSRSAVANSLRLLALEPEVGQMVRDGLLTGGHARAVLAAGENQKQAAEVIVKKQMSVRQAESYVKRMKKQIEEEPDQAKRIPDSDLEQALAELENRLGRRVTLRSGVGEGELSLAVYSSEDLEHLIEALKNLNL